MSQSTSKDIENREKSGVNTVCHKNDANSFKDADLSDNSQELFSDEEESDRINRRTPQQLIDDCSFLDSFKTPALYSDVEESPCRAVVPKTPMSLAPYISKINEPWTSDLETPDAKLIGNVQVSSTARAECLKNENHESTPKSGKVQIAENELMSPILTNTNKKIAKRQIFKLDSSENCETAQHFENSFQITESSLNVEEVENSEAVLSPTVKEEFNNFNVLVCNNENSSLKCLDLKPNNLPESSKSIKMEPAAKSLGDVVREVKRLQKSEEKFQILEANISEDDLFKDIIQLEHASTISSFKKVDPSLSEIGLVPFSQFFKDNVGESFNETIPKEQEKIIVKAKNDLKKSEELSNKKNQNVENKPINSTISRSIKVFDNTVQRNLKPTKETSENSKENEESDLFHFEFSQWEYGNESRIKGQLNPNAESQDAEEEVKKFAENVESLTEFDKTLPEDCPLEESAVEHKREESSEKDELPKEGMLQNMDSFDFYKDFCEEIRPQDLKKPPKLEVSKPLTICCGFSTAGGKSIQISREKFLNAEKVYKETENNQDVFEFKTKKSTAIFDSPSTSKAAFNNEQNSLSNFKTNFVSGFATASGKNISVNQENISKAKMKLDGIEMPTEEEIEFGKENQSKLSASSSRISTNLLNNSLSDTKRKLVEENSRHSKKFKALNLGIPRNSLGLSRNLRNDVIVNKNVPIFPVSNNKFTTVKSFSKCDPIVPRVKNPLCGFTGAKSVDFDKEKSLISEIFNDIDISEYLKEAEAPKSKLNKKFSLPVSSEPQENIKIKQRRSLQIPLSYNKNSQQTSSKNSLIKGSRSRSTECLIPNSLESPPFCGFNSQVSTSSVSDFEEESPPFYGFKIAYFVESANSFEKIAMLLEKKSDLSEESFSAQADREDLLQKVSESGKVLFTEVSKEKEELEAHCSKSLLSDINPLKEIKSKISEGLSTPSCRQLSISANELSKINSFYSESDASFSETTKLLPVKNSDGSLKKKALSLVEEVHGRKIELPKTKLSQSKSRSSNRKSLWNSILKRKFDDANANTPLGRHDISRTKKPKVNNSELHGRKLFSKNSMSDDENENSTPNKFDSLGQPGTSSSKKYQDKAIASSSSVVLTSDNIISDIVASEEFFKPFSKEAENCSEKKHGFNLNAESPEEANDFSDVRRSPILGKTKLKKNRRTRLLNLTTSEFGSTKDETVDSDVNIDSALSLQNLTTQSVAANAEILEKRIAASFNLDKTISRKRKEKPRPIKGSFLTNRDENRHLRISLHELTNGSAPKQRSLQELKERGIDPVILNISASTAEFYKFRIDNTNRLSPSNIVSLNVGDGATLVLDENGSAGVAEFETAFEASPGVDPGLLPTGWVRNHYRWIVWKLASMDRMKLGSADISSMLTPDRVMKDLKYRYDREIDRSQRPAIRKILEKDDVPTKKMVLCIASITESSENEKEERDPRIMLRTPRWKVEITDGWYSIPVSFDTAMVKNIIDGKIQEGTKIVTYGAELLNCDSGCFPLEKPGNVCLKIHTNSTRRARWDAKLGYQLTSGPIVSHLKDVDSNGGFIAQLNVVVSRIYPILYKETTADGQKIYRNAKAEEKAAMAYAQALESKAEAIYAEAEKKYERSKRDSSEEDSAEFLSNYESSEYLSKSQKRKLSQNHAAKEERLKLKINEKIKANLPPPRQVAPVQNIRVVEGESSAMLTIWSESDDNSILKEGSCYSIFNINTYGRWDGDLKLSANRQTIFKPSLISNQNYPCRIFTSLNEISAPDFDPYYSELDTVGVVSWIELNTPHGMKNFESVCLSYPNEDPSSSTYLSILFWRGIASSGFSNIFTIGSLIACSNLEIRTTRNLVSGLPVCYSSDRTVFTTNPRQAHLLNGFKTLKEQITDTKAYAKTCGEEISTLIQKKTVSRFSNQGILNSSDRSSSNYSPHSSVLKTPSDFDTPGKSGNQRRTLSRCGETPKFLFHNSINVMSNFKPVFRTPDSTKSTNTRLDLT